MTNRKYDFDSDFTSGKKFGSAAQECEYIANRCEKWAIIECGSRDISRVPAYLFKQARDAGYRLVKIGGTTNQHCVVGATREVQS